VGGTPRFKEQRFGQHRRENRSGDTLTRTLERDYGALRDRKEKEGEKKKAAHSKAYLLLRLNTMLKKSRERKGHIPVK